MSLLLEQDTRPKGLWIKSLNPSSLMVGDYVIGPKDFNSMVMYVLTNTDLVPNDTRLELIEHIKKLKIVKGFNFDFGRTDSKRLSELTQEECDEIENKFKNILSLLSPSDIPKKRLRKRTIKKGVMKLGVKAPKSSRQ